MVEGGDLEKGEALDFRVVLVFLRFCGCWQFFFAD